MTSIWPWYVRFSFQVLACTVKFVLSITWFLLYINENDKIDLYIHPLRFFRFLPRLLPNKVADRVVTALRCNEKLVIIPGYIRFLVATKWFFPWSSVVMFVQNLFKNTTNTPNITSRKKKKNYSKN